MAAFHKEQSTLTYANGGETGILINEDSWTNSYAVRVFITLENCAFGITGSVNSHISYLDKLLIDTVIELNICGTDKRIAQILAMEKQWRILIVLTVDKKTPSKWAPLFVLPTYFKIFSFMFYRRKKVI